MPRSVAKTPLTIRLTSGRGRTAAIKTTKRSIQELSTVRAFVQARIRSPLTKCENRCCARRFHPRTHLCYATESFHSPECQEIMVAFTRQHTVGLPNDISLFASRRRSTLPPAGERLFWTADCHICSSGITRIVLFNGLSVSNLRPSHQQPRGLCTLFVSAILFLCAQDCDRGAQSFILVCLTELGSSGENRDILCNFIPFNYYLLICFLFLAFSSNYLLLVLSLFT